MSVETLGESAKATLPSPESLAEVSTPHDPGVLFFLLEGDDSVTAGYLATLLHPFHRQVVSSKRALALRGITAPGHHQVHVEPIQGHLRVRGVDPGRGQGDVVGARDVRALLLHLVAVLEQRWGADGPRTGWC